MPVSLQNAINKKLVIRCPDCQMKFVSIECLSDHIMELHKDNIPDGVSVKRYIFNRKYKKTKGSCVIDKKETRWDEDKGRYERYCSDRCKRVAREQFRKNAKRKLGTDNPAATPEHQINAIKGRGYSGEYTFTDGGIIGYSSSYEMDFLRFVDNELDIRSMEVDQCEIIFDIFFDNKKHFHIPDFYLPSYKLIVNIKTFQNNNSHIQGEGKMRQMLADKSIIDSDLYNYILILDKEYSSFVNMMKILKDRSFSDTSDRFEKVIHIPKY